MEGSKGEKLRAVATVDLSRLNLNTQAYGIQTEGIHEWIRIRLFEAERK